MGVWRSALHQEHKGKSSLRLRLSSQGFHFSLNSSVQPHGIMTPIPEQYLAQLKVPLPNFYSEYSIKFV